MASSANATKTNEKSSFSHCTVAKGGKIISSCSLSLLSWTPTAQGSFARYIPAVCFIKQTIISGKTQLVSGERWWEVLWREQWKQAPLSSLMGKMSYNTSHDLIRRCFKACFGLVSLFLLLEAVLKPHQLEAVGLVFLSRPPSSWVFKGTLKSQAAEGQQCLLLPQALLYSL